MLNVGADWPSGNRSKGLLGIQLVLVRFEWGEPQSTLGGTRRLAPLPAAGASARVWDWTSRPTLTAVRLGAPLRGAIYGLVLVAAAPLAIAGRRPRGRR